jgi:hypothetical protein
VKVKCIYCDHNTKYKVSDPSRCENCGHAFAWPPKPRADPNPYPYKLTDQLFRKVISDVSADGTRYFTLRQFLFTFDRRVRRKQWFTNRAWIIGLPAVFFGIITTIYIGTSEGISSNY